MLLDGLAMSCSVHSVIGMDAFAALPGFSQFALLHCACVCVCVYAGWPGIIWWSPVLGSFLLLRLLWVGFRGGWLNYQGTRVGWGAWQVWVHPFPFLTRAAPAYGYEVQSVRHTVGHGICSTWLRPSGHQFVALAIRWPPMRRLNYLRGAG